jgi:hypothetical protein
MPYIQVNDCLSYGRLAVSVTLIRHQIF